MPFPAAAPGFMECPLRAPWWVLVAHDVRLLIPHGSVLDVLRYTFFDQCLVTGSL
jgi:hypothetical protein